MRTLVTLSTTLLLASLSLSAMADETSLVFEGKVGPGHGKQVVLVSGDEEYRSEEALPQLAKILATHHGFKCTVLFAIDRNDGTINPKQPDNIPGLEALDKADLLILFTRFRDLPDDQMKHLVDYIESGRPVIGMRTATHAFNNSKGSFTKYSWQSSEWEGGFGRQVLGETWINHHGNHGSQSTRGLIATAQQDHPILRGIKDGDIWGPTDVYGVRLPLPGDSQPLVLGEVSQGMTPDAEPVIGPQNDPMMPVAWIKTYESPSGKKARVFTTTMGAATDLQSEGLRRLLVNAAYWCLGMEDQIGEQTNVAIVGKYEPSPFRFDGHKQGAKVSDLLK